MKILAIDTSCDETAAAVTNNTKILSNVIWSQASLHAKFGGVLPSLAQRQHQERIDFIINKALIRAKCSVPDLEAIAVTIGPGLAIALGVGIEKAKKLANKYGKPLIPVNHTESHLLSPLAGTEHFEFPSLGLVVSGGTTQLVFIKKIGNYRVLAETEDDALGEALDKAARLLGFGYPGGAVLEKFAKDGNPLAYPLPLPLKGDREKNRFSYSGLKTAFVRLVGSLSSPNKKQIADLAASFQNVAFDHVVNVLNYQLIHPPSTIDRLFLGGGVANNVLLRSKLRTLLRPHGIKLCLPYSNKLLSDNAGMVGVCAYLKTKDTDLKKYLDVRSVDREPRMKL